MLTCAEDKDPLNRPSTFVLPFAHQFNLMVMGPGGYKTKDFVKVGTGLSVVMVSTAVVLLSL